MNAGISDKACDLWFGKILNDKTPKEILIITGGLMLAEYVSSFDQKEPGKELDEKLSSQRQKYLKRIYSFGLYFLEEYGAEEGSEKTGIKESTEEQRQADFQEARQKALEQAKYLGKKPGETGKP